VAANQQQGSFLAIFLISFTVFPAGFVAWSGHPVIGGLLVLASLALMIYSLTGFYRIKRLESSD
jgi:hypothetical protein